MAARFVDWLAKTSRPWLVVLDDLRDPADLRGLWPAGPTGRLLITTASPAAVTAEHRALALPVPAFSTREAMNYLSGRLSTDPDQRSAAIDLAGDLGCEPPALAQASAVIASSGVSCRDYRQHFTQRQKQLAEAGRAETPAAVFTTKAAGSCHRRGRAAAGSVADPERHSQPAAGRAGDRRPAGHAAGGPDKPGDPRIWPPEVLPWLPAARGAATGRRPANLR